MATSEDSSRPNILITGTPGTGKTCTSELVSEMTGFKHLNVGSLVSSLFFLFFKRSTILSRHDMEMMIIPWLCPIVLANERQPYEDLIYMCLYLPFFLLSFSFQNEKKS